MKDQETVLRIFPGELRTLLSALSIDFEELQELRLRVGKPLIMRYKNREYGLKKDGRLADITAPGKRTDGFFIVTDRQIKETVELMSRFSLYAVEEEIRQGFLTIQGGHRVGIGGRTVLQGNDIRILKHISCLNVRVAHEKKGCADAVMDFLYSKEGGFLNTLVISPPGGGKTTLLRDMIRQISDGHQSRTTGRVIPGLNVGVADERSELGACYQGVPQNDLGLRTDILDGCPKEKGMMMLVRTMAPDVIAVDEAGGEEDVRAIAYAGSCGCGVAATVHGRNTEEILEKPELGGLIRSGFFKRLVLLGFSGGVREIHVFDGSGRRLSENGKEEM